MRALCIDGSIYRLDEGKWRRSLLNFIWSFSGTLLDEIRDLKRQIHELLLHVSPATIAVILTAIHMSMMIPMNDCSQKVCNDILILSIG